MNSARKIAIVDDHTMFRKGLASLISLFAGYEVIFDAGGGEECIRRLEEGLVPDILLMDIVMPGIDGFATTTWVREHLPDVRVIALSTMDSELSIIRMITSGARGYLLKDSDPAELKRAFEDVLSLGYYYNDLVSRKVIQSAGLGSKLTDRELNFLQLACSEKTYAGIAGEMYVSERTVDGYRDSLFRKLNVTSRVGLVLYALRNGIVKL
jgi:DNA-binding NarL/FixJ family response regulator